MSAGDRVRAMHRGALCINDVGRMKSERERERERETHRPQHRGTSYYAFFSITR